MCNIYYIGGVERGYLILLHLMYIIINGLKLNNENN